MQQQQHHHHHNHLFNQNIEGVSDPDTGACLEHMTQSDTSSDYALPPDDSNSNLGFSCRVEEKETCFVCVGVDSQGGQVKDVGEGDEDDSADKWAIFEVGEVGVSLIWARFIGNSCPIRSLMQLNRVCQGEVIKAGFLVHLQHNVKGWHECWCIFTGHDLRIYPIKVEPLDHESQVAINSY